MDITRNHWFAAGLVLLALGLQVYWVEAVGLTPELTQFLGKETGHPLAAVSSTTQTLTQSETPALKGKYVRLPDRVGWLLGSVGVIMVLHSWAMPKSG
jgi:hypothetical protein